MSFFFFFFFTSSAGIHRNEQKWFKDIGLFSLKLILLIEAYSSFSEETDL